MKKPYSFISHVLATVAICNYFVHFVEGTDCTLKTPNPTETELLKKLEPLKGKQFSGTDASKNYTYYLGICADAVVPSGRLAGVGLVQIDKHNNTKQYVIGKYDDTQLLGGVDWIMLKYKDGDPYHNHCNMVGSKGNQNRQAIVMITCAPSLQGDLLVIEENTDEHEECYYLLQFGSSVACKPRTVTEDGLSAGSIFCIILLTSVGLYLLIGFLHQRIVVGAKGLEQIPNYNMWKEFGKLQADGCDFLCRCGERQEAKMYRGIDDQLLNPETMRDERDDRLLPM